MVQFHVPAPKFPSKTFFNVILFLMQNNYKNKNIENIILGKINEVEQIATRKGFGEGLFLAGKENSNVVALSADLTESTQVELFKKSFPYRFFEMGVAEQNMASVGSGLAAMGKIPFIASYATFSPGRNWEQIRTTICYNNMPVKIIGHHAGFSPGPDGGTHQALEDIAIMRALPNMIVVVPCDAIEAKKATIAIAKNNLPSYLRVFREKSLLTTDENSEFEIGKANVIYGGGEKPDFAKAMSGKVGIIACGEMVARSLMCVKELEKIGIEVGIMNLHTIKPIDKNGVLEFVKKYKNILTVEEHQVAAGMGSAVLESLSQIEDVEVKKNIFSNLNIKIMGIEDRFGQSGSKEDLYEEYGLNEKHILKNIKKLLNI